MSAAHVDLILPGIFRWNIYSPEHRCDLTSHAVADGFNFLLFDPISISAEALDWFPPSPPTAILLTNSNHLRNAREWSERFSVSIFSAEDFNTPHSSLNPLFSGRHPSWEANLLPGGPEGEAAFRLHTRSLMVFGDAMVNLPHRGLEMLPAKYCSNSERLCASLERLVENPFNDALFAHGEPLLGNASEQILDVLRKIR